MIHESRTFEKITFYHVKSCIIHRVSLVEGICFQCDKQNKSNVMTQQVDMCRFCGCLLGFQKECVHCAQCYHCGRYSTMPSICKWCSEHVQIIMIFNEATFSILVSKESNTLLNWILSWWLDDWTSLRLYPVARLILQYFVK